MSEDHTPAPADAVGEIQQMHDRIIEIAQAQERLADKMEDLICKVDILAMRLEHHHPEQEYVPLDQREEEDLQNGEAGCA